MENVQEHFENCFVNVDDLQRMVLFLPVGMIFPLLDLGVLIFAQYVN